MKKLLYTLLAVSFIFSACKKEDECKTCGTWYKVDSNLTQAEQVAIESGLDDLMLMSEDQNMELCDKALENMEQIYDAMGSSSTTQMSGYSVTSECR